MKLEYIKKYLLEPIELRIKPIYFLIAGACLLVLPSSINYQVNSLEKALKKDIKQLREKNQMLKYLNDENETILEELIKERKSPRLKSKPFNIIKI